MNDNDIQPLTVTVEQAAKLLGIGRSTAYELVRTGDLPSLRLGRRIVVPTAKLALHLGVGLEAMERLDPLANHSETARLDHAIGPLPAIPTTTSLF